MQLVIGVAPGIMSLPLKRHRHDPHSSRPPPKPGPEHLASARLIDSGTEFVRCFAVPAQAARPDIDLIRERLKAAETHAKGTGK